MKPNRQIIDQISREIMRQPLNAGRRALSPPSLPLSSSPCATPEDMLAQIRLENQRRIDHEKDKLSKKLGRDNIFRFGYVPLVISELAWDYADTVLDLAETMRLTKVRPLCRAIKKLRADYLRYHNRYIDNKHLGSEIENMYVFENGVSDIFRTYIINLKYDLLRQHPGLSADSIMFLTAVYQCRVVILALQLYAKRQTDKISRLIGRHVSEVVPSEVHKLGDLIIEFAGDCPASDEFEKLQDTYVSTLATQIALIDLTPNLN